MKMFPCTQKRLWRAPYLRTIQPATLTVLLALSSFSAHSQEVDPAASSAGMLGKNVTVDIWDEDWRAQFDRIEDADVATEPLGDSLMVGFRGDSWPDSNDFVLEKQYSRSQGDEAPYNLRVEVMASRHERDNHELAVEYSLDGSEWQSAGSRVVDTYATDEGNWVKADIPVSSLNKKVGIRVVIKDTNDWEKAGSRLHKVNISFEKGDAKANR